MLLLGVGVALAAVWGIATLWSRGSLVHLAYRRSVQPQRIFPDEPVNLVVTVENRKLLPVPWLRIEEDVPEILQVAGQELSSHNLPQRAILRSFWSLGWFERVSRRYTLHLPERGWYALGPTRLISGDLFGLRAEERVESDVDRVTVYPRLIPLERLGLPAGRPPGETRMENPLAEDPLFVAGVREYTPGDRLRRIHWPASARTGRLQAKLYEPRAEVAAAIFLNVATYLHPWEGIDRRRAEFAISLAASLAADFSNRDIPVGLYANGHAPDLGTRVRIPPHRRRDSLGGILDTLAKLAPYGTCSLEQLLEEELPRLRHGTTLVVVTAVAADGLWECLARAARLGYRVVVLLLEDAAAEAAGAARVAAMALAGIAVHRIAGGGAPGEEVLHVAE